MPCCRMPVSVALVQVTHVRVRQRAEDPAKRASSRLSAPNALTTGLQLTASASAPPRRLSHALERRVAGVT